MSGTHPPQTESADRPDVQRLIEENRDRLLRMVSLRMDRRLQGRIDASDVVQEAAIEATERLEEYSRDPKIPPFLWLRLITGQRLIRLHRQHLGVQARDVARELPIFRGSVPGATSNALAVHLVGRKSSPSHEAMRTESTLRVQEALEELDETDREILALRHTEQLTNGEVAATLGLDKSATSKRYVRALRRLRQLLAAMPGGLDALDAF